MVTIRTAVGTKAEPGPLMERLNSLTDDTINLEVLLECRDEIVKLKERYYELLYCVGSKYPGESRHETAKRYLQEREAHPSSEGADKTA